ncbi:unnamed protein product [Peronospora belbahrii]|uniref:Amidohydrolase 3 domain-containing protein n=1 Tax=Peronospora belbahrii TaxID=622444 RepID=A0ABN8D451_9STRA|nr:unnamed protein product [Peronospora belbahrii]
MKVFVNGKIWQWADDNSVVHETFSDWMTVSNDGHFVSIGSGVPHDAEEIEDLNEFAERLRIYDNQYPDKAWVVGYGWAQDDLSSDARYPSRHDIDAVIQNRPVLLHRACWHIAVVNTKALEIAGVELTATSYDCKDGAIDADEEGVTGIVREHAVQIVEKHAIEPSLDLRVKYYKNALRRCVSSGLTAVHTNDEDAWHVYTKLQNKECLPVRVYLTPSFDELGKPTIPKPGDCNGLVSCHRMKIFSDGSLGAETAALRVPYKGTCNKGILMNSDEDLVKKISDANNAGYRVEIHAIGDRAAEQVLKALRNADVGPQRRPILTHCQILGEDLILQMHEQGVIGNIQPSFAVTDAVYVRKRLQDDVIPFSYCWKRMLDGAVMCAGGSDAPIETCNPFQGLYDAMYRHKPDRPEEVFLPKERLLFHEALALYTKGGAFAAMEENRLGHIASGFYADFVVLRKDVTQDHRALLTPNLVDSVWVNGKKTYQYDPAAFKKSQHDLSKSSLPGKNGPKRVCQCCRR